jgi:hypothetical protein
VRSELRSLLEEILEAQENTKTESGESDKGPKKEPGQGKKKSKNQPPTTAVPVVARATEGKDS